jgi:DNA (cytosine-5)-methyltransferase 1
MGPHGIIASPPGPDTASERLRFVDLFAGLGGFHAALSELGHDCVFASEIDDDLRALYKRNFPDLADRVFGDIRDPDVRERIPSHDVLCAGFPCQPFSKSGYQRGWADKDRGGLFWTISDILREHQPRFLILENVGNFERHDGGNTWRSVEARLIELGYDVAGTCHRASGGPGLMSPHHLGYAHTRERFFIVGSRKGLSNRPFPEKVHALHETLLDIAEDNVPGDELHQVSLRPTQEEYIDHWNILVKTLPSGSLPSFPLWGDEFWARYEYRSGTPWTSSLEMLRKGVSALPESATMSREELLHVLPSYARDHVSRFPLWKQKFIRQNREWYAQYRVFITDDWLVKLRTFPFSHRKLEWNVKGGEQDLWECVLQFRPSGIRAKRYTTSPSLVAMTVSQIPILGPKHRFLTVREGLRLQGFDPNRFQAPLSREKAFHALGNAVHTGVAKTIAAHLLLNQGALTEPAAHDHNTRQLSLIEHDGRNGHIPMLSGRSAD